MVDTRNPASDIVRTAAIDSEGVAVFTAEDFMGFMAVGMGKDGETKQVPFDGKSAFSQSELRVQIALDIEGYAPKKAVLQVSVDSPISYDLALDNITPSSTVVSNQGTASKAGDAY